MCAPFWRASLLRGGGGAFEQEGGAVRSGGVFQQVDSVRSICCYTWRAEGGVILKRRGCI